MSIKSGGEKKEKQGTFNERMSKGFAVAVASTSVSRRCMRASAGADGDRNEYTMRCKLVRLGMPRRASQSPVGCLQSRRYRAMVLLTSLFYYDVTTTRAAVACYDTGSLPQALDSR